MKFFGEKSKKEDVQDSSAPVIKPAQDENPAGKQPRKMGLFGRRQNQDDSAAQMGMQDDPSKVGRQEKRKGGFFSKKADADQGKLVETAQVEQPREGGVFSNEKKMLSEEERRAVEEYSKKKNEGVKKRNKKPGASGKGLFRKKDLGPVEPAPVALTEIPGVLLDDPTFSALMQHKNITYPVKEPFQFVNIRYDAGETSYNVIEPALTMREKGILSSIKKTYDMLVNSDRVLVDTSDKIKFVQDVYDEILDIQGIKVSSLERQRILYFLIRDYVGYGEIDTMMNDRLIEDISCNGPDSPVYVYHRVFESTKSNIIFEEMVLNSLLLRLAQVSGRHISILQPIRDAALPDGSRINMTMGREVTKKGATFTIRKFRSRPISPVELIKLNTVDARIFSYLWLLIEYGSSILISGGTAAGKTTLLNGISMLIKQENKVVSIEDTPEINLASTNWIQAITRIGFGESSSSNSVSGISGVSGKGRSAGDISLFDLLVAALRQRPEYLIVGEVRGEEAYTLFQAISVGHSAMGTIHAASMSELLARVESPPMNVPRVLLSNTNLVIFVNAVRKDTEKVRRIRDIVEVLGLDPETKELVTNVVFRWDPYTDTFEYGGRSFLLEKISDKLGIPKEKLYDEMEKRMRIFEYLIARGISDYREVSDVIRNYYKDPAGILNAVEVRKV